MRFCRQGGTGGRNRAGRHSLTVKGDGPRPTLRPLTPLLHSVPETLLPAAAPDSPDLALAFRAVMGHFATGVAVIALRGADGAISAMTINSLVSISLDPMLVSWSLQNAASQYAAYAGADRFAISILAESQQALARRYAARGNIGLVEADFTAEASGLPVISGAIAHIACRRYAVYSAGDHSLILGEVTGMAQGPAGGRPLVFFGGRFGGLEA